MKNFLEKFIRIPHTKMAKKLEEEEQLKRQVTALFGLLSNIYGADKLILKASKLDSLNLMRSTKLEERVLALQKLTFEDPTIEEPPERSRIPQILEEVEEELANIIARRTVEDKIERKIAEKMQERHEEYIKEIKMQLVKEQGNAENAQTLKKLAHLEKLDRIKLAHSIMETLRPASLKEIVGQDRAVKALLAKVGSPYPQHVILYGPPGVGKTSAARLALEEAKKLSYTPFDKDAPFVEVDGTTLRWDPREVTNPLIGSVHDPIYQGARRDLAESGVPEPKPGLVTDAHGGVLFIDEIGELDPMLLNKLLKVLEDKKVNFDSSYYDPGDPHIPQYIKKLFDEGAPADFILIGATTREPAEINPAIRSRCAEIFFESLTQGQIQEIIRNAAAKLKVRLEEGVAELISEYTIEGRKAVNLLADVYGLVLYRLEESGKGQREEIILRKEDVYEVAQLSRLTPYVMVKASSRLEVGKIFGLGVAGYLGSVIEIEAVAFSAREPGKGSLRFNETAGSMAKDSVFNAASVIRKLTGLDIKDYDLHINVVGGGRIDGPSAGVAVCLALLSAVTGQPLPQDIAVTGEISIQGRVKPVGGVFEKIYGARQAGVRKVYIPKDNAKDIPQDLTGIDVVPVEEITEILEDLKIKGLWDSLHNQVC